MIKELNVSDTSMILKGSFCVSCISHCQPLTEVNVQMGHVSYKSNRPNIETFAMHVEGEPLLNFFNGIFCDEIKIDVPDAHIRIVYEDLNQPT